MPTHATNSGAAMDGVRDAGGLESLRIRGRNGHSRCCCVFLFNTQTQRIFSCGRNNFTKPNMQASQLGRQQLCSSGSGAALGRARASTRRARAAAAAPAAEQGAASGRGVLILPGLANNAADYAGLAHHLNSRGLATSVVQVGRADWGRNAAALTDRNWWAGTLKPRPAVDWYLDRVSAAMDDLKRQTDGGPVTLLCHSAGGWLGRVWMLDFGVTGIDRYITLGSPHAPPPPGVEGVVDQTRGILNWCSDACPGAHHPEVKYITIAGRFVKGVPLNGQGSLLAKFAGAGYAQVCGQADVDGDFIVPLPSAHLDGAVNVNLDGVFHSPLGTKLPFFGPWYGSDEVVDTWMHWVTDDWEALTPGDFEEPSSGAAAAAAAQAAAE